MDVPTSSGWWAAAFLSDSLEANRDGSIVDLLWSVVPTNSRTGCCWSLLAVWSDAADAGRGVEAGWCGRSLRNPTRLCHSGDAVHLRWWSVARPVDRQVLRTGGWQRRTDRRGHHSQHPCWHPRNRSQVRPLARPSPCVNRFLPCSITFGSGQPGLLPEIPFRYGDLVRWRESELGDRRLSGNPSRKDVSHGASARRSDWRNLGWRCSHVAGDDCRRSDRTCHVHRAWFPAGNNH